MRMKTTAVIQFPTPRREMPSVLSLTVREYQVAAMADEPDKVIAWKLGISIKTVKAHLVAARQKLGCPNRTKLYARVVLAAAVKKWQEKAA